MDDNSSKQLTTKQGQYANPMGLDGFEFVEFASTTPNLLHELFQSLGFVATHKHKSKNVTRYKQGDINLIVNNQPNSFAAEFAKKHGSCACAMAFRVKNAEEAYERAVAMGVTPYEKHALGQGELEIPAIIGIGGSLLYFVDKYLQTSIYDNDFNQIEGAPQNNIGVGLKTIDHLTHNVYRGDMDKWSKFYEEIFNFYEIRYFDIQGKITGLTSRALSSPCGKIKIPLNQSKDDNSQIEEYLKEYKGEGIQHIALDTDNIFNSVENLRKSNIKFLDVPATYYEMLEKRIPGHNEDIIRMQKNSILIDGSVLNQDGILLQIFTQTVIGPIFFEIIQRKGNEGFGEGNFQALFESIERDQIKRGVIKDA